MGLRLAIGSLFRRASTVLIALLLLLGGSRGFAQTGPLCFFSRVADRMIRQSTTQWCARDFTGYTNTFSPAITAGFSLTNIPVLVNSTFVYSPAVNRLLQLSANIYDATTTNFYPSVFRPTFFRDAFGNVFIHGYTQVVGVTNLFDPQVSPPVEVNTLPAGCSTNVNVYGVPWIIGAKKYLPSFNQFYMQNAVQVTRKMQVWRDSVVVYSGANTSHFHTNELILMSITNHVGFSLWNSYTTNYPGGTPIIFLADTLSMALSNGLSIQSATTNFSYVTALSAWPGSAWDASLSPQYRQPSPSSFIYGGWDFAFLPVSAYQFATGTFAPLNQAPTPTFDPTILNLPLLPQLTLTTTNSLYAFILDGTNVIDYVQYQDLVSVRNLNSELQDIFSSASLDYPLSMWITNGFGVTQTGPNIGVIDQLAASEIGPTADATGPDGWQTPANMPPGLAGNPSDEAAYFRAFFTGEAVIGGNVYSNTNLTNQLPYVPVRTLYDLTLWQANDPLVHYLASDLNEVNAYTGIRHIDDPTINPPTFIIQNSLGQNASDIGDDRYQPWGVTSQLTSLVNVDTNPYNLAYRDPLVYGSDDWDFPTQGGSPLDWLGRVHRGTPWQTVYLKSTNLLALTSSSTPTGLNTWSIWTGDTNLDDAAWSAPVNDWQLASLVTSLLNTNNLSCLLSVNNPDTNAWQAVLNGLTACTNSTPAPIWDATLEFDPILIVSNSPSAAFIASAIQTARASQPGQIFNDAGDVFSTAALAEQSPFLNIADLTHQEYSISDEAYEKIPSQLLSLLRTDSIGSLSTTNGQFNVQFTGYDGHSYVIQSSPDLVHWTSLVTNQPAFGTYNLTAPLPPASTPQFYRSMLLP